MLMSMLTSEFYQTWIRLLDITYIEFKVIGLVDFAVARNTQNSTIIIIIKEKNKVKILRVITIRFTLDG